MDPTLERVAGIGPAYLAWEASALPLSYTRRTAPMIVRLSVEHDVCERLRPGSGLPGLVHITGRSIQLIAQLGMLVNQPLTSTTRSVRFWLKKQTVPVAETGVITALATV